jgi:hypothetical protein
MNFAQYKKNLMYAAITIIALIIRFYVFDGKESWHDE